MASILNGSIRKTDSAARLSGDEYSILPTKCDIDKVKERAGYIRHNLRKITLFHKGNDIYTSASMGFAVIDPDSTLEGVFERADKAMCRNKRDRKNSSKKFHLAE